MGKWTYASGVLDNARTLCNNTLQNYMYMYICMALAPALAMYMYTSFPAEGRKLVSI